MKKYLLLILATLSITSYAIVPTTDVGPAGIRAGTETANDAATMGQYVTSVSSTMNKIQQTYDVTNQMKNLQGLQKLNGGGQLCELCNASDSAQLSDYRNSINTDLCSQFSLAFRNLTGVTNAANSLSDIMQLLSTDPKAAMLSLQQASVSSAQTTNSTLAQMQLLQTQMVQKQLADEKNSQQVRTSMQKVNPGL
jgi:hypothetical protein